MSTQPQGLLFVLAQYEPDVSTEEFDDWYEKEHVPARLAVPGITTATRYKAVDSIKPEWITICDLTTPSVVESPEYLCLREGASSNEKSIILRLPTLQRRVYSLERQLIGNQKELLPGKFVLVVFWSIQDELVDKVFKWYDEEHMKMISQTPGWLQGRIFKLVYGLDLAPREGPPIWNYMAIHDYNVDYYFESEEFQKALATPLSKEILGSVKAFAPRKYKLHKSF